MINFLSAFQTVIIVIHFIMAFFLISVILLQAGKGTDIGAAFGAGGAQSLFGAAGGSNFLTRLTTIAAIVFLVTSLGLATTYKFEARSLQKSMISDKIMADDSKPIENEQKPETPVEN